MTLGRDHMKDDMEADRTFTWISTSGGQSNYRLIQIATWNDFGRGTTIEPSHETEFRHLEAFKRNRGLYAGRSSAFHSALPASKTDAAIKSAGSARPRKRPTTRRPRDSGSAQSVEK